MTPTETWQDGKAQAAQRESRLRLWKYLAFAGAALWITTLVLSLALGLGLKTHAGGASITTHGRAKSHGSGDNDTSLALEVPQGPYIAGNVLVNSSRFVLDSDWDFDAPPTTRDFSLSLNYVVSDVDGFNRTMIAINHLFPGPVIECNVNDTIRVNVTNNLSEPTSIHWHGIYQQGTPYMDGVAGVSQCPIPVGEHMVYEFTITNEWGTFWYHSHYGSQYNDGAFGPIVVHSTAEPYRDEYQGDMIIFLSDWYHTFSNILTAQYLNATGVVYAPVVNGVNSEPIRPCNTSACYENVSSNNYTQPAAPASVSEPKPDGALLNGLNFWNCSSPNGQGCAGGRFVPTVEPGKTYRLRLINSGAYVSQMFTVDNHPLQIIEADGNDINKDMNQPIDGINLAPAQRYSVLLNATAPKGNYYMRTRNEANCSFALEYFADAPGYTGQALGVLHYDGADPATDTASQPYASTLTDYCVDPDPSTLTPYYPSGRLPEPDTVNILTFGFYQAGPAQRIFVNTTTWVPLIGDATLLEAHRGQQQGSLVVGGLAYNYPSTQLVTTLEQPAWTELVINSGSNDPHPFHLHGQDFNIVGTGTGTWNGSIPLNTTNPPQRDTAVVPASGWIAIRWYAQNAGLWPLHCHFSWHLSSGLLMQFAQGSASLPDLDIPDDVQRLLQHQCQVMRDTYGGGVTVTGVGK